MTSFSLTSSPSLKTCFLPSIRPIHTRRYNQLKNLKHVLLLTTSRRRRSRRFRNGKCSAEFSADAPVAIAIGACILNSLVFPLPPSPEDVEAESLIDSADARFAVMGIISFIPYFNWMSWVFAWMDTGKQRYAVYAIVYLAPYLRSNLSISPEDSWLPIASILLCILHIQLEVSIKNGDLQGFQIFNNFSSITRKKNKTSFEQEERKDFDNLPSSREEYRDEIRDWTAPQKPYEDHEILNEDEEDNRGTKD